MEDIFEETKPEVEPDTKKKKKSTKGKKAEPKKEEPKKEEPKKKNLKRIIVLVIHIQLLVANVAMNLVINHSNIGS